MADKFSVSVRRILAERAGYRCSNPDCGRSTSGPSDNGSGGSTVLGKACHITAASEGGPRFDSTLGSEQRTHPDNGIWLCAICADRVDKIENVAMFPVELLRCWKEFHESLTGTDHASVRNRRDYPLRQLKIVDFAGVRGQASMMFGALTLVLGSSRLSHTIGELLNLFSSHEEFRRTGQPPSEIYEEEIDRISLPDERAWVTTVRYDPPRLFTNSGRVRLKLSDNREFIITAKRTGATLSLGDSPIPVFSPAITTIVIGKPLDNSPPPLKASEQRLARYFGMSEAELRSCVEGVPTDESLFGYGYDFNSEALLVRIGKSGYQSLDSLSGGERSRVLLDLGSRVARYRAKVGPFVFLVDQHQISMDRQGWDHMLAWLEQTKPPFQTVVDLWQPPSKGTLSRAVCYEALGTDMEVSSFQIRPLNL